MSKKIDLRASLRSTTPPGTDRFALAQAAMQQAGGSLLAKPADPPAVQAPATTGFHVETGQHADRDGWNGAREVEVELRLLHDNPYGARTCYTEELIAARARSIKAEGQLEPIKVSRHPDLAGQFIIIDGGCRRRALQVLGRTTGRVAIRDEVLSGLELHRLSRIYNKERDDGSVLDDALVWKKMLDDGVVPDQDALATQDGVTKGQVSKTLAILKLPASVISTIEANPRPVTASFGYALYQFATAVANREDGIQMTIDLVGKVQREEISCLEIDKLRKRFAEGKERKPRESSRQYNLQRDGRAVGTLKEWDNGKVMLEIVLEDPEDRERIVADLKARFVSSEHN